MSSEEIPLVGGNISDGVVRVGDTVRRPSGPWTPAVHALLRHLHEVGFSGAPRPLGIDERGREVLSFVPGTVAWPDRFDLVEPEPCLARVARLVRDYHDAASGFVPPPDAAWNVLFPQAGREIISHNDLAPWNLVVGDDHWAFIDWDAAAPGTRLWDVAYALHGFVPLQADPRWHGRDSGRRMRVFADAYGLDEAERRCLVPLLVTRTRAMHDHLAANAAAGVQPWATMWQEGHGDVWRANAEYIEGTTERWTAALLG